MEYKVKPFTAKVSSNDGASIVGAQVQRAIEQECTDGWEFVCAGNVDTEIEGSNGCFGFGAKPGGSTSIMVLVFRK